MSQYLADLHNRKPVSSQPLLFWQQASSNRKRSHCRGSLISVCGEDLFLVWTAYGRPAQPNVPFSENACCVWNWTVECLQHLDLMYSCNARAWLCYCIANKMQPFFTWTSTDIGTADGLMMQLKVVSSIVCFSWFVHCSEYAVSSCLAHYLQSIKYNKNWIGTETEKQSKLKLQLNSNYF